MEFTRDTLKTWLGVSRADEDAVFDVVVAAVKSTVGRLPGIDVNVADNPDGTTSTTWADSTVTGALMLGARLYRRRNSPNGIEAFTEGGAAYVSRYDPDVARLLHVDGFTPPAVG